MNEIILSPLITEKSSSLLQLNKYSFNITLSINKIELKRYVERVYDVRVLSVNFLKKAAKKRRRGKVLGYSSVRKVAIVTLATGESIDDIKDLF